MAITSVAQRPVAKTSEIYSSLTADTIPDKKKISVPLLNPPNTQQPDSFQQKIVSPSADTTRRDTIPVASIPDTFNIKFSKDTLDAPVNYEAADSGVLMVKDKKFLLYGNTKTTYKDVTLTAPTVVINQETKIVTAYSDKDSTGDVITRARFTQGTENFQSDTIEYNFKTQKGLTYNTYTKQDEMWVQAAQIKKVNANTTFARKLVMTTCDYDEPHFGFVASKGKFISNKLAITGPIHPEFEGVPIPIYLPFGFFPLNPGRHSGLLPPRFAVTENLGIGLEGLGYFHVINDYVDFTIRTNFYSYGSWNLNLTPTYRKRYKYSGGLNISIQNTKANFKGDPDFALNRSFQVSWNHSMDQKAKPGTNFSANVTAGSTSFNQYVTTNPIRNVQNQLQSSITYSKTWGGKNLTLSANHNQNNFSRLINVTLPDAGFSIPTLYPLQRKNPIGAERWYEKIGIGYNGTARNQVAFYDTALRSFGQLLDTLQLGAQHRLPITMSLPPLGKLIVSPAISYEETWFTNRIRRRWNDTNKKIDTVSLSKGFYTDRQMSFSISINTALFGTVVLPKSKLKAIRHTVRPQFSLYYRPNLSANKYDVIRYDTSSQTTQQFSQFNVPGNLFSGYGYGKGGGISFGIDNNLEAKWRGKKDSVDKKIRLIDGFGFNSAYNFLAPAFKLSPFNLYIRSTLFEKFNISATANLDPYRVDSNGQNINEYAWSGSGFNIGRITNANISMSTRFQSKPRDPKQAPNPNTVFNQQVITDPNLMQDKMLLQDYMQRNPADFVDFNIPWSVDVNFALTLNRIFDRTKQAFKTDLSSSLQFNNSFSLTPKWNFTTNGFYDLDTKQLTQLQLSISREMHCWQMAISVSPIGQSRFFTITISPRSSILQDLRINRTRAFYDF